jgi:hypothetical protein
MATNVNDRKPVCTATATGNYGGKKVYVFKTQADANTYYLLAYTSGEASSMATQIAADKTETISTAVALQSVFVTRGHKFA